MPKPLCDDRLDILFVGPLPPHRGGSGIVGAQVVVGLAKRGHAVRAVVQSTPDQLEDGDAFAASHSMVRVTRILVPAAERFPEGVLANEFLDEYERMERGLMPRVLERLIAERAPDVIVIGRDILAQHVSDVALASAIPTALLIQNTTNVRIVEQAHPPELAQILRKHFEKMTVLITVARHLGDRVRALGFLDVRVIENTVDLERFAPRPRDAALLSTLDIREDDVVVAHLSNLKPVKRPFDLVESAVLALRHNPRLVYLVLGHGPLRPAIEEACRRGGVIDHFRFVGWVDHAQIPNYLTLADMVVMPSEVEARALVYLETQACGRVLIASDIPAAREVIADGETGLLFKKGDVEDLAARTLQAAGDPRLRARIGAMARRAAEAYPLDAMLDAYEATLSNVARCHGR